MSTPVKKAYTVCDDETGCIVFAARSVVARRRGANELDIDFDEVVSCKRSPHFDKYADTGVVPVEVQIANGWQYECFYCSSPVDHFTEAPQYEGTKTVYCCDSCRQAAVMRRVREEQLSQAVIEAACTKWPGIVPLETRGCSVYGKSILFKFPGGQRPADWTLGEDSLHVDVSDHPAWAAFTGKPVEIVFARH
jgi:hypothetical protein